MAKTKKSVLKDLLMTFSLATLAYVIWLGILWVGWFILRSLGYFTSSWAMIEALSTALGGATILIAGLIAYRELSEAETSRHIEIADRLFEELNSEKNIEARRWVFQNLPSDPKQGLETLSTDGQKALKRVLNSLDRVSFLTQEGWISDEVVMPWMHPMIAKSWEKVKAYVEYERVRRDEPYYYAYAEKLAVRCNAWREKNLPKAETKWVDHAL